MNRPWFKFPQDGKAEEMRTILSFLDDLPSNLFAKLEDALDEAVLWYHTEWEESDES